MKQRGAAVLFLITLALSGQGATIVDLGEGFARSINDAGQVAGFEMFPTGFVPTKAYVYRDGQIIPLMQTQSDAAAINQKGQVVGTYMVNNQSHAFLFSDGALTDIIWGWLTTANGLNDLGQVVGFYMYPPGTCDRRDGCTYSAHAYMWYRGTFTDLNTFLPHGGGPEWVLAYAYGINNQGMICGAGSVNGSEILHGFLLIP